METQTPQPNRMEQLKRKFAEFLTRKSQHLSVRAKKTILLAFGILATAAVIAMMIEPFRSKTLHHPLLTGTLTVPPVTNPFEDEIITEDDYLLLVGFTKTLDSLRQYDPVMYRELLKDRDGLLDSIQYLIGLYKSRHR